jgi:hypothetical protein
MNSSSSAIVSAFRAREPAGNHVDSHAVRQGSCLIVSDTMISWKERGSSLWETGHVLILVVLEEDSRNEQKAEAIRMEEENTRAAKICLPARSSKSRWIGALICVLLATTCAVTVSSIFQAPLNLRTLENPINSVKLRAEIAALPACLAAQRRSNFGSRGSQAIVAGNRVVIPAGDTPPKGRIRDRFQQKQLEQWARSK